jgi:hypothetical protein
MSNIIATEHIEHSILFIRGQKVMLDSDLASLYGVNVKRLNEAVKRNTLRFPEDFMFQLSWNEYENLKSQIATSSLRSQFVISRSHGGKRKLPYVFTEYGVAMLSSVLRSERAILVNIEIMRAFGKLRQLLTSHKDLARRLNELEKNYDKKFSIVFQAIKQLMEPPIEKNKKKIGFNT